MRRAPFTLVCVVFGFMILSPPARATTVLPLSLTDLVERSDVIVHVRVGNIRIVQRNETPFRVTELYVMEAFQGARRGEVLELWQRGDGNIFVIGDPWLEPQQEGLAFLRRVEGRIYLTALAQSFWWFEDDGPEIVAQRDLSGLMIIPFGPRPVIMPPNRLSWEALRQLVLDACMGVQP